MSDVSDLIEEARETLARGWGVPPDLVARLADALEAAVEDADDNEQLQRQSAAHSRSLQARIDAALESLSENEDPDTVVISILKGENQ